jgi:cytochrome c
MHPFLPLFAAATALALSFPSLAVECDVQAGQQLFQTKCSACHSMDSDHVGPHLAGVVGRPIGSVPGFNYSSDLAGAKRDWSPELIERWLTAPAQLFPETIMAFGGMRKAQERQAVICFLKHS